MSIRVSLLIALPLKNGLSIFIQGRQVNYAPRLRGQTLDCLIDSSNYFLPFYTLQTV